jgi:hypothetical protein
LSSKSESESVLKITKGILDILYVLRVFYLDHLL